jgi:hypothetical protein
MFLASKRLRFLLLATFAVLYLPASANAQPWDTGDAPEGQTAYPAQGVPGLFPTCLGGPAGFVQHAPNPPGFQAYFGPGVDYEPEGNAGFCPPPPYERDECWWALDNDAGIVFPTPWTIHQNQELPCGPLPPTTLGQPCSLADWGPNGVIDISIVNQTGLDLVVNVLADWNQDGQWGGATACPAGGVFSEQVVHNLPVPPFFIGNLSALGPAAFRVGPNAGFVWFRFTLSERPGVPLDWNGSHPFPFDIGETEDYLFLVGDYTPTVGELGDAPEGAPAYPGVLGQFPTCIAGGPSGYVWHGLTGGLYLGPAVDAESDGNASLCPPPPYDQDECFADGDAGLRRPVPLTWSPAIGVTRCGPQKAAPLGRPCSAAAWGSDVDIALVNNLPGDAYLNVLFDWDANGLWEPLARTCAAGWTENEHVLVNFPIPAGFSGDLSNLSPPGFAIPVDEPTPIWCRFTISDQPVQTGWDGAGVFGNGETEDYLLYVAWSLTDAPDLGTSLGLELSPAAPNPFNPRTCIAFTLPAAERVRVTVHDAAGRRVATLVNGERAAGRHELVWNGENERGATLPAGVYIIRMESSGEMRAGKVSLLK